MRLAQRIRREWVFYRMAMRDPRTPRAAKFLIGFALGYALSPIDLIPDWIPVLGHLDDVLIVPLLLAIAWRLIPRDARSECRKKANTQ